MTYKKVKENWKNIKTFRMIKLELEKKTNISETEIKSK